MSGFAKTAIGFASGVSPWVLVIVFGVGVAVGTSGAAWVQQLRLDAVKATVTSYQREARDADERAQVATATSKNYLDAYNKTKADADANDAKAAAQLKIQSDAIDALATQRSADQAELAQFRSQIDKETHAPDATAASVARSVLERLRQR